MSWIVLGEESGKIKLVSKSNVTGLLPKGSYLTIEDGTSKFILRVDDSSQSELFSPKPMIVEMDMTPLRQDQECQNIITAYRVRDLTNRSDGYIDFIKPQSIARRSNQAEIDLAIGIRKDGPQIFVATIHSSQNQILRDDNRKLITARLPKDMYYHQIMISGRTGSGKTVAMKYLAQHFVEKMEGAVLAINVKDIDFLTMNRESTTYNEDSKEEWNNLAEKPHGVENCVVYYPSTLSIESFQGIDYNICKKISLDVKTIEPEALAGLLQGISEAGALNFPNIFRYWQEKKKESKNKEDFTFLDFVRYFAKSVNDGRVIQTRNSRGDISEVTIHKGTFDNIQRNLDFVLEFFDNEDSICINETDILTPGKLSIINVAGNKGIEFGSILLRDLLNKIVEAKDQRKSDVPILIIIDEVHRFYNTESSNDALDVLDTICRTGRSKKIGVIFSSQNPTDIPRGLSSVINTKIFFKSDAGAVRSFGLKINDEEMECLKKGYAISYIHEIPLLKVIKFPMSLSGVHEQKEE